MNLTTSFRLPKFTQKNAKRHKRNILVPLRKDSNIDIINAKFMKVNKLGEIRMIKSGRFIRENQAKA